MAAISCGTNRDCLWSGLFGIQNWISEAQINDRRHLLLWCDAFPRTRYCRNSCYGQLWFVPDACVAFPDTRRENRKRLDGRLGPFRSDDQTPSGGSIRCSAFHPASMEGVRYRRCHLCVGELSPLHLVGNRSRLACFTDPPLWIGCGPWQFPDTGSCFSHGGTDRPPKHACLHQCSCRAPDMHSSDGANAQLVVYNQVFIPAILCASLWTYSSIHDHWTWSVVQLSLALGVLKEKTLSRRVVPLLAMGLIGGTLLMLLHEKSTVSWVNTLHWNIIGGIGGKLLFLAYFGMTFGGIFLTFLWLWRDTASSSKSEDTNVP